ncbi:MAG: PKD domain-containing protein, partial [Candidatus Electryonea clarkiae]|nr:PKD domain-containing protein [Candidatus Electryonea clarkiae]
VRIDSESPTIINEFICADTTSSTVDLEWSPTTDQHFMQYEIYYSSSNTITLNDSVWNAVNDTTLYNMATTQTTIYGVDNSAEIYFAICAVDSASNRSAFSEVIKNIPVTYPPVSYAPFPVNQPEPEWSTSRNVEIGITFSDFFGVDTTSVQYRIDKNGNSYYDSLDVWNDVYSNTDNNILSSFSENYLESASSEVAPEKIMKSPKDNRSSSANDTLVVRVNVDYEVDSDYLCFEFRAKDINGYGYSYSGENQTPGIDDDYLVRIDATPPDSIDLAQSGYPTDTTLTVAWNTSSDMFFDTYQIYYATHHSITEADMLWDKNDDPLLSDPLQNFSTITGLNSSTTYFFKVRAIDLAGNKGAFSPECYATTSGEQPQIVSDFIGEPLEGGAPLVVQFTDLSTCNLDFSFYNDVGDRHSRNSVADKKVKSNNGRDILTWEWDFDNDGAIDSFVQNPAHTYTDAGIYTVTLIISSEGYSSIETKTDYITVFLQPIHFSTVYQGNGYNNMTFSISEALIGGTDMVSGDEIGIFDGELCVGAAILTGVISADRDILQMVASADDPTTGEIDGFTDGNTIIYRLWDASEVTEITYVLPTYTLGDGTFSQLGTAMVELAGFGYVEQTIGLLAGWNMISFYNEPDNMDMMAIMQGLIDAGELFKVQDEGGLALVELPPPIGWYNGIGDMATTEGYYIKVLADTQLYTVGSPVSLSIEITLLAGWNMMSYPCQNPQNALSVLQPLIDAGVLEKVQNEAGLAIVELPPPIGWYNGIGDFLPGEGYYIKVNANVTLIINCNLESVDCGKVKRESINKVKNQTPQLRETTHFIPIWDNNPYMAMNVFVTSLEIEGLSIEPGDELGIFDGDICVGSAFIEDDELISLIASTDDPLTEEIDGFTEGNEMSFRFWDSSEDTVIELTVTVISGDETFASLGTSVLDLEIMTTGISDDPIPTVTKLDSNYPNPFNPETTINFSIKESGHVTLEIYNIKGQKVKTLVNDVKNAGYHSVVWDGTDDNRNPVSSGIYLYKMNGGNQIMLKKMLLVK